ncbi:MAG: VOC family protein [Myxococcota bacterium]|nr:VOC family protein [Myxococcota bacterium]
MALEIVGLDHLVLRVRDLESSIAFYCEILGCQEERRLDELGLVQLRAGRSLIDLVDVAAPLGQRGGSPAGLEGRNLDHFALQIRDWDAAALRAKLAGHGIESGPVRELYGAEGVGEAVYIRDPDGNTVELKAV